MKIEKNSNWTKKDIQLDNIEDMRERHKSICRQIEDLIDKKLPNHQSAFNKMEIKLRKLNDRRDLLQKRIRQLK